MVALWSQVTVFLTYYARKSRERNCKKTNKFCNWLTSCLRICDRKLEVCMRTRLCMHDYTCNMFHTLMGYNTLARITQLVAWNSEPPSLGPG